MTFGFHLHGPEAPLWVVVYLLLFLLIFSVIAYSIYTIVRDWRK